MADMTLDEFPTRSSVDRVPPQAFFLVSAVFHYFGPALAVLLFAEVAPLGVAWLRIGSAAIVFAIWRRPWRLFVRLSPRERLVVVGLGVTLAAMNACFYEAIARLPLVTAGAIARAFTHPVLLAAAFGIGISSSVIPYVCDQLAMARLPRATFSLMLSLLPATAAVIGITVLHQYPTPSEIGGIAFVIVGIGLHRATQK